MSSVGLPDRLVPLHRGGAPDVVHEDVQRALLGVDARDQRAHLLGHEVVDLDRDAAAAGRVDERGGLLDRLRPVHLRPLRARRAPGAVDGRAGRAELHGDAAPRAARARRRPARPFLPMLKSCPEPRPRDVGKDTLDVGR